MYLMYVDESGDPGIHEYGSKHFILSGIIISQDEWNNNLQNLKKLRKELKQKYGLNQRTEIHASELIRINKIKEYSKFSKTSRINILRDYTSQIPIIFNTSKIINVCLKKSEYTSTKDIQEVAWNRLIQRFDTHLKKDLKDRGIIITDDTSFIKIRDLLRKMRVYNPVQSHYQAGAYNAPTDNIIEDIFTRDSTHSYFIQTVDVVAHLLYRKEYPKGALKKFGIESLFNKLTPLLLLEASKNDKYGIVRK